MGLGFELGFSLPERLQALPLVLSHFHEALCCACAPRLPVAEDKAALN